MKYILYIVYSFFCLMLFMYIKVYTLLMTGAQGGIRIKMQLKMNYQYLLNKQIQVPFIRM